MILVSHEPNLCYTNNYKGTGKDVLFLHQVDDFAISCADDEVSKDCIQAININSKIAISVKEVGIISHFNGIDVDQTQDFIKLSNATYIAIYGTCQSNESENDDFFLFGVK